MGTEPRGMLVFSIFFFNPCNRFKGALLFQPCKRMGDNAKSFARLGSFNLYHPAESSDNTCDVGEIRKYCPNFYNGRL